MNDLYEGLFTSSQKQNAQTSLCTARVEHQSEVKIHFEWREGFICNYEFLATGYTASTYHQLWSQYGNTSSSMVAYSHTLQLQSS